MARYAKAIVAIVGAALTASTAFWGTDTTAGRVIAVVLALLTATGVWAVPNRSRTS